MPYPPTLRRQAWNLNMEYSRTTPSSRYTALTAMYRQMHAEGEKLRGLSPEDTFPGQSLPPHVPGIKRLIDLTGARTLLDYGSGKGRQYQVSLLLDGSKHFSSIQAYWCAEHIQCFDPSYPPFSAVPEGKFDGVICTDVLEHCPEEDMRWIVDELFRFANKFVYANVACYPAGKLLPNGENAHCTIRPVEWWAALLSETACRHPEITWEVWLQYHLPEGSGQQLVETRLTGGPMSCRSDSGNATEVRNQLLGALRAHQAGDFDNAAELYRRALALNPQEPDGNRLYGTLCLQTGRFEEAERYLRLAVQLAPADAESHNNLGAVLIHLGRPNDAIPSLHKALSLRSKYDDASSNLGEALRQTGDPGGARAAFEQALAVNPRHANALYNLGVISSAEHDSRCAIEALERSLAIFPGHIAARLELANACINACDYLKAEEQCRIILAQAPDNHAVRVALASIYIATRRYDDALVEARQVLDREADHPQARVCLGQIIRQTGGADEALPIFQEVLSRHPEESRAACGIVEVLLAQGKLDAAREMADETVARHPGNGMALLDQGTVLEKQGLAEEACEAYRKGLILLPEQPALHFNLGNQLLLLGNFEEGWREYEWRSRLGVWGVRNTVGKYWKGEGLEGRTLLIEAEQGMGDMIQFVRLAPHVAERGGTIMLECQPELARLFNSVPGIRGIVAKPHSVEFSSDYRVLMLSLPGILGIRADTVPARIPYLAPPEEQVRNWRNRLQDEKGLRIGFAWSGNRQHIDDANRSCPMTELIPLLDVAGTNFFSLQKDSCNALLNSGLAGRIRDYSGEWADFADTAAFMQSLDLVITVDTAVAHLAGALGIPVWTLLPFAPDWRWLRNRSDSPWYPTMRLFRPPQPRAWTPQIAQVADELGRLISARTDKLRQVSSR